MEHLPGIIGGLKISGKLEVAPTPNLR